MEQQPETRPTARLSVENIGGIESTTVELQTGVNVLAGRNATNRTSLLQAIIAVLGSDDASLKSDAEVGHVELEIGSETYTRHLRREDGEVVTSGTPYAEETELAELFAFLLGTNEARQTVLQGQDLRELIVRPIDTDAIEDDIERLRYEKADIEQDLDRLSDIQKQLPELEQQKRNIEVEISDKKSEKSEKEGKITEIHSYRGGTGDDEEIEELIDERGDIKSELASCEQELESQRESLEDLEKQRERLSSEASELPASPEAEIETVDEQIEALREDRQEIQSTITTIQRIVQFNRETLDGGNTEILSALTRDGDPTEDPEPSDAVGCWTCGHDVGREDITATIDRLDALRQQKLDEVEAIDDKIDERKTERITYREKRRQREQVLQGLEQTRERIAERESRIAELTERRDHLEERLSAVEQSIDERQSASDDRLRALRESVSDLTASIKTLKDERDAVAEEIDQLDQQLDERDELRTRHETVTNRLERLQSRIEMIETGAIEAFNEQMATVLDILNYENVSAVRIERLAAGERGESDFTLHIVRTMADGTTYEDDLTNLSESEREVIGLVFALAGYLVHEVHEQYPFMLLDSLEAIDAERIATLVDHYREYPDFLVAALLEEDAEATDAEYRRITDI